MTASASLIQEAILRIQMMKAHINVLRNEPGITPERLEELNNAWTRLDILHRFLWLVKEST